MDKRYRGFISYSHADEKWALWLHRQLERYRVPGHIRKSGSAIPARLNPIFLDRQELASSPDLGSSIREALTQSSALLLVCSPDAAASKWVNEEIKAYRELCPDGNILCLMVAGSPNPEDSNCAFPPALLDRGEGEAKAEPLAADISDHADGKRGALLKIVSGLLGVGVDALRRRDHQRRIRVLGFISALATLVSVVTIVLAISAINARDEADLRRNQAEELIEFMLVELRSQLEPQGKLSLLDSVGEKAMQYFSALGTMGTEKELLMRAMALRQIGEVRFDQGQLEPALIAFTESHRLTKQLYKNYPDKDEILFEHSQSEFWMGYVVWERLDLASAEQSFGRYYDYSLTLAKRNPLKKYQMELIYALTNLAAFSRDSSDLTQANYHIVKAVDKSRTLLLAEPQDEELLFELSEGLSFLGSITAEQGELIKSETIFQEAFDHSQKLHQLMIDNDYSASLGNISNLLGDTKMHLGKPLEARITYDVSLAAFKYLIESDPENIQYQVGYYRLYISLGTLDLTEGQIEDARSHLLTARNGFRYILDADPSYSYGIALLAEAEAYLALVKYQTHHLSDALERSSLAYNRIIAMVESETLSTRNIARVLNVIDIHARILSHSGNTELSKNIVNYALSQSEQRDQGSFVEKAMLAKLYSQIGKKLEATELETGLAIIGFRDPRHAKAFAYF
ncbi:MAG: toll/interleukin-1 receptor domain-containing protein [Halioglobus sp.]